MGATDSNYFVQFLYPDRRGLPPTESVSEDVRTLKIPKGTIGFIRTEKHNGKIVRTQEYLLLKPENVLIGVDACKKHADVPRDIIAQVKSGEFAGVMRRPRGPWQGFGYTEGKQNITILNASTKDELWPNPAAIKTVLAKKRTPAKKHIPGLGTNYEP